MKAVENCFPVVLFIMLHKLVVVTFESVDEILKCDHSNGTEQYFPVLLVITLYKVHRSSF